MVIAFFGHAKFPTTKEVSQRIMTYLENIVGKTDAQFYLGGYGDFDSLAYECCKKFKEAHPQVSLVFVTPYITLNYQNNHLKQQCDKYDAVIYPEIEDKPLKFAIYYRNRWMVEKADCVICGITHAYGGAYKACLFAKRRKKTILNVTETEI